MNGTCLFLGILFTLAGIFFYSGKAIRYMAPWKQMPAEEKKKIRIRPLCRNIGSVITVNGIIFILSGVWSSFRENAFLGCIIAWLILSAADVYWIEKSGRYQIPEKQ